MTIKTPIGDMPDRKTFDKIRAKLAEYNRTLPATMTKIHQSVWPFAAANSRVKTMPVAAWRSARFIAALYIEPGKSARRLSICRAVLNDRGQYEDGLSWDELQAIKTECGFGDYDAVEIYPRNDDVVNVANMRHLWILDDPSALAWRS